MGVLPAFVGLQNTTTAVSTRGPAARAFALKFFKNKRRKNFVQKILRFSRCSPSPTNIRKKTAVAVFFRYLWRWRATTPLFLNSFRRTSLFIKNSWARLSYFFFHSVTKKICFRRLAAYESAVVHFLPSPHK